MYTCYVHICYVHLKFFILFSYFKLTTEEIWFQYLLWNKSMYLGPSQARCPCWLDSPSGEGWSRIQVFTTRTVSLFFSQWEVNIICTFVPGTYTSNQLCIHNPSLWWRFLHLLFPDLQNHIKCSACHLQMKSHWNKMYSPCPKENVLQHPGVH